MKSARALSLGFVAAALVSTLAWAKLPAPVLTDEAKAKAAEAAAKTAHGNKVADYKLCLSMDRVAAYVADQDKKSGKTPKAGTAPACADPGAFVYVPAPPAAPAVAAAAVAPGAAAAVAGAPAAVGAAAAGAVAAVKAGAAAVGGAAAAVAGAAAAAVPAAPAATPKPPSK